MGVEAIVIYILAAILFIVSVIKDKEKTKQGVKKGVRSFLKLMPVLVPLFVIIGVLLAVVTPELIGRVLGEESGLIGMISGLFVGSVTFMPPFVAFPLGRELLDSGAAHPQVAGFLVTLMSVGVVYFAAESRYFSKKSAFYRNLISFGGAMIVIMIVWVIYT